MSAACIVLVGCATPIDTTPQGQNDSTAGIQAAIEDKARRTQAEAKLDSQLLAAIQREKAGQPVAADKRLGLEFDADGRVLVDIRAEVNDGLIRVISDGGGVVVSQFPKYQSIRAWLHLSRLQVIAERADVKSIRAADRAITNPSGR